MPKIAIVADWLTNYGGAEQVISAMHEAFPEAPIYTTLFNKEKMKDLANANVKTTYLQKLPFAKKDHKPFLSLMPHAIERLDLSEYDIVLSSAHSVAKGVLTKVKTLHICYCHNPMRYCWDDWQNYIKGWGLPSFINNRIFKKLHKIRMWDRIAADRVDYYIANSQFVAKRIHKYYRKSAEVIPPPVNIANYNLIDNSSNDYYFTAGRLVPFKKYDLIIETFNKNGLPLKIAGKGPELEKLKKIAGPNIELLGFVDDKELSNLYENCKAFIFAHLEDAGITPMEAMACGKPVIAYNAGGAKETVIQGKTGVFFDEQQVDPLNNAVKELENMNFNPHEIRNHALQYERKTFIKRLKDTIQREWQNWNNPNS